MLSSVFALLMAVPAQSGDWDRLDHLDPEIRLLYVKLAVKFPEPAAVNGLIRRLDDSEPAVRDAAREALTAITGRTAKDADEWRQWWTSEGSSKYVVNPLAQNQLLLEFKKTAEEAAQRAEAAKRDVRAIALTGAIAILLFIMLQLVFVGHVSSKIKGWRELVARAETYIKHGQELTDRTDRIAAELEAKKAEVAAFFEDLRKELDEGIARRSGDLGAELVSQLRMDVQTLRQKAERELDQTVTDLKTQIETTARRAAADVRDRLAK
jgi:F0F1-type ATP synthase membrane subunit b/b'